MKRLEEYLGQRERRVVWDTEYRETIYELEELSASVNIVGD